MERMFRKGISKHFWEYFLLSIAIAQKIGFQPRSEMDLFSPWDGSFSNKKHHYHLLQLTMPLVADSHVVSVTFLLICSIIHPPKESCKGVRFQLKISIKIRIHRRQLSV